MEAQKFISNDPNKSVRAIAMEKGENKKVIWVVFHEDIHYVP